MENLILNIDNLTEGAIIALKMMGGVAIAAVLLYLVLLLTRVLGGKLEEKKYQAYVEKYSTEHGNTDGMMTKEEFVLSRIQNKGMIWSREGKAAPDTTSPLPDTAAPDPSTPIEEANVPLGDGGEPSYDSVTTPTTDPSADPGAPPSDLSD